MDITVNKLLLLATRDWTGGKNGTYTGHNNLCFPLINCQLLPQAHLHVLPIVYFFRTLCLGPRWLDTFHVILLTDNWADAAVASEDRLETPNSPPKSATREAKLLSLWAQWQSYRGLPWAQGVARWPCDKHNHFCHFVSLPRLFVCNTVCNFHVLDFKHFM